MYKTSRLELVRSSAVMASHNQRTAKVADFDFTPEPVGGVQSACERCGKLKGYKYPSLVRRFCSRACSTKVSGAAKRARNLVLSECAWCEAELELAPWEAHQSENHYCNRVCMAEAQRGIATRPAGWKHTEESMAKIRDAHSRWDHRKAGLASHASQSRKREFTGPEKAFYQILEERGEEFEPQVLINERFVVDALAGNVVYEVFGCYWHNHARVDSTGEMLSKDRTRVAYLTACGYEVKVIWECEINMTRHSCKVGVAA